MPNPNDFKRFYGTFAPSEESKQVDFVDFQLVLTDAVVRNENNEDVPIYFTDLQFQPGNNLSGWNPHTKEMLKRVTHVNDETQFVPSNSLHLGREPQLWEMNTRWFNIVGRGHSIITLPNYFPEDWDVEILPTGIDFTIKPKEDFDVMRISTGSGVLLPYDSYNPTRVYDSKLEGLTEGTSEYNYWNEHPLHYRYTREFWVDGYEGSAGHEIKIHASSKLATMNGNELTIAGERYFNIDGWDMFIGRKKFLLSPKGSTRFRVEFYKQVPNPYDGTLHLKDTGIGFHGVAEFSQWAHGRSRI